VAEDLAFFQAFTLIIQLNGRPDLATLDPHVRGYPAVSRIPVDQATIHYRGGFRKPFWRIPERSSKNYVLSIEPDVHTEPDP
jgi:hypothetical protein